MRQGFFDKQRRDEKQRVFEKSEPTLCLGLRFIAGDHLHVAELLRRDVGPQHKARGMLLGVLDALGIQPHLGLHLPRVAWIGVAAVGRPFLP